MVYELPIDLYKDWKDLAYTKELFENIVKELKEQINKKQTNSDSTRRKKYEIVQCGWNR